MVSEELDKKKPKSQHLYLLLLFIPISFWEKVYLKGVYISPHIASSKVPLPAWRGLWNRTVLVGRTFQGYGNETDLVRSNISSLPDSVSTEQR